MNQPPRVAFFTDCFHEVNGVALTSRQLEAFAQRREFPFFSLHIGPKTEKSQIGSITRLELTRSFLSFAIESDMSFDLAFMRYRSMVRKALQEFKPDLIHITGPGDVGILGAVLAYEIKVPLVASWHTNVHEYGGRRLESLARFLPKKWRASIGQFAEDQALNATLRYYQLAKVLLAPNAELIQMLERRARRPTFMMQRGVDTILFDPAKRSRKDDVFSIGFVGRLSAEKNVRFLADIERGLLERGLSNFKILVVGQGAEREWLGANLKHGEFGEVLKGEALAAAYADMDVFAFPSKTDTFGNVIQEAQASGVPSVVTNGGGPKFLVQDGVTGFIAQDDKDFIDHIAVLVANPELAHQMGTAARAQAMKASWDRVMENVYRAYEALKVNPSGAVGELQLV